MGGLQFYLIGFQKMKKKAGDDIQIENSNWSFSGDVVGKFDRHVEKSVPLYNEGHELTCELGSFFVHDDSIIYEIGSSTGVLSEKLAIYNKIKVNARIIGIDIEQDMVDFAKNRKNKRKIDNLDYFCEDIVSCELERADLIVCYYTMQFIPTSLRQQVIDKLYKSLNWGGGLIMFEKVRAPDARFQDIINTLYMEYKLKNGYTESDILNKTLSLKSVLEPFSTQGNIDMLKRAGFVDIVSVQKYLSFEGFLAIK